MLKKLSLSQEAWQNGTRSSLRNVTAQSKKRSAKFLSLNKSTDLFYNPFSLSTL
jgi:hypothetical protein